MCRAKRTEPPTENGAVVENAVQLSSPPIVRWLTYFTLAIGGTGIDLWTKQPCLHGEVCPRASTMVAVRTVCGH